jgi:hypothetical protein
MSTNPDRTPEGSIDPEEVREASAFTIKELRAKLGKLRLIENMERISADARPSEPDSIEEVPQTPPESLDPL